MLKSLAWSELFPPPLFKRHQLQQQQQQQQQNKKKYSKDHSPFTSRNSMMMSRSCTAHSDSSSFDFSWALSSAWYRARTSSQAERAAEPEPREDMPWKNDNQWITFWCAGWNFHCWKWGMFHLVTTFPHKTELWVQLAAKKKKECDLSRKKVISFYFSSKTLRFPHVCVDDAPEVWLDVSCCSAPVQAPGVEAGDGRGGAVGEAGGARKVKDLGFELNLFQIRIWLFLSGKLAASEIGIFFICNYFWRMRGIERLLRSTTGQGYFKI